MTTVEPTGEDVTVEYMQTYFSVRNFLTREADLLDDPTRWDEWLETVAEDLQYEIPTRVTRERGASQPQFSGQSFHLKEDYESLQSRIERLQSEYAWSENPPVRSRRFVANLRLDEVGDEAIEARTNVLLVQTRGDENHPSLVSAVREDTFERGPDGLVLADRTVLLDHTSIGVSHLPIL